MKQTKRKATGRLALLGAVLAALVALAACSGGNAGNDNNGGNVGNGGNSGGGQTAGGNGGGSGDNGGEAQEEALKLSFMIPAFQTELPDKDSPVLQALQEATNTEITMQYVPNSSYPDKMNITLASGQLPTLMVVDRNAASFINAARSGAFWELGPYLDDYPNLSQANPIVLNNSSIDGKTYGIYRGRILGRMGVTLNRQWMENLGLEAPQTLDEFYNVLKAFKEDDPDGNGKDDTYGIVVSKYAGPWDIMQVWFGAPNKWGEAEDGTLAPAHTTPEYLEALQFFRTLYVEGLVNEDFAVMDPAVWTDPMVNQEAGVFVDVADAARRMDNSMQDKAPRDTPYVDVFQAPVGPKGHRDMPTSGYANVIAVSKSAVKTEDELKRVLTFLDRLNDEDMQMLLGYGIEGRHYEMVDGYIHPLTTPEDVALSSELNSLNQMLMFIGPTTPTLESTEINDKVEEVQAANEAIVVGNPAEPLISDIYAQKGQQLDNIIADARIKYIVGQIDEQGLEEAFDLWMSSGGADYIAEINTLYEEAQAAN
ncbi:extracellular solute-binding protein [Paenibacillus sp. IB182496]|uniref:Extracellular solute-binding protein n=1 Tax=Paenibacillus sabuli TaxID=2772509 RepID=A0A927BQV8_9BACL|nr:extracellular solute-binding protein [Paenibacillus sabuli]MBD2843818.1 extracellular solute-binding protein [Paenibacillus sabuli]